MSARSILVTGATGQLGQELQRCVWPHDFAPVAVNSDQLDLCDLAFLPTIIARGHRGQHWAGVVNAAAYTAVDKAESEPAEAWRINALAPAVLADACSRSGIPLIHVSTDYVFDGSKNSPWEVDDPVGPINVYGASKLAGELGIRATSARHAIIRTSWVISAHGNNFLKTMLRIAQDKELVRVVADQQGSPTGARDLAQAVMAIAVRMVQDDRVAGGTYHFSNAGPTTWADVAVEIFRQSARRGGPSAMVEPITTQEYPTAARRPQNSLLSHVAIARDFDIISRPWGEALDDIVREILGAEK